MAVTRAHQNFLEQYKTAQAILSVNLQCKAGCTVKISSCFPDCISLLNQWYWISVSVFPGVAENSQKSPSNQTHSMFQLPSGYSKYISCSYVIKTKQNKLIKNMLLLKEYLRVIPQSQETERQSGNTGRLHSNPFGILKFTEQPKTPGINIQKHGKH